MCKIALIRISNKKNPRYDYHLFQLEIERNGFGLWDNDHYNSLEIGDIVGFILGPPDIEKKAAIVVFFKITSIDNTLERYEHWSSVRPYTANNGKGSVKHRNVIKLEKDENIPGELQWHKIREITKLGKDCKHWMPRNSNTKIEKNILISLGF